MHPVMHNPVLEEKDAVVLFIDRCINLSTNIN